MNVRHADRALERIETEDIGKAGFSADVIKAFRKRMQMIRAAVDERDFYALKSLRYEKLKGNRSHQRSMPLNDQFRLILQIGEKDGVRTVIVAGIEDYH